MKISDLLSPRDVLIDVRAANKRQLLEELAAKAAISVGLGVEQVRRYLLKREELGSTGVGGGIAIPHARLPDLQRPYGLLAKLKQPMEFDAIVGQAVDGVPVEGGVQADDDHLVAPLEHVVFFRRVIG